MINRWNHFVLLLGIAVMVNLSACAAPTATLAADTPAEPQTPVTDAAEGNPLARLAEELSQGRLEDVRQELTRLETGEPTAPKVFLQRIESIVSGYDQLSIEQRQAHEKAYQDYAIAMLKSVDAAHWRQAVLDASRTYKLAAEEKTSFESELADKVDKDWLTACLLYTSPSPRD